MNFKYHDENGKEIRVTDPVLFAKMIRNGSIHSSTLIFDEQTSVWKPAWEYEEYHSVITNKAAGENQYSATPDYGRADDEYIAYGTPISDQEGIGKWALPLSSLMLVAGMVIAMITIFRYSETPFAIGYKLGSILSTVFLSATLSFFVWRFPLNRKKGMGLLLFAACFLGTSLYNGARAFREAQSDRFAAEEINSIFKEMNSGGPTQHRNIDEKKYGSFGPLVKITNDYAASVNEAIMSMNREIEELSLQNIFTRETLQDTEHIDQGQARLQKALDILDTYEEMLRRYADEVPQKINGSSAPENVKRDFSSGFNASKEAGLQSLGEFFNIERALISKTDNLLNFVRSKKGRYRFVGDQITFNTQPDSDSYNNYLQNINLTVQQETEWQAKAQRNGQEQINKMEKELKKR